MPSAARDPVAPGGGRGGADARHDRRGADLRRQPLVAPAPARARARDARRV